MRRHPTPAPGSRTSQTNSPNGSRALWPRSLRLRRAFPSKHASSSRSAYPAFSSRRSPSSENFHATKQVRASPSQPRSRRNWQSRPTPLTPSRLHPKPRPPSSDPQRHPLPPRMKTNPRHLPRPLQSLLSRPSICRSRRLLPRLLSTTLHPWSRQPISTNPPSLAQMDRHLPSGWTARMTWMGLRNLP